MENLKELLFQKAFNYCNEFYRISEAFNPYAEISETEKRLSIRASTLTALIAEAGLMDEYNIWKAMRAQSKENEGEVSSNVVAGDFNYSGGADSCNCVRCGSTAADSGES